MNQYKLKCNKQIWFFYYSSRTNSYSYGNFSIQLFISAWFPLEYKNHKITYPSAGYVKFYIKNLINKNEKIQK